MGFGKKFRSLDIYGFDVGLLYKGNGTYTTNLGAAMTLVTLALMGQYVFTKTVQLALRDDPETLYNTGIIKDMSKEIAPKVNGNSNTTYMNATDLEFGFMFLFVDLDSLKPIEIDPTVIEVSAKPFGISTGTPGKNYPVKRC
jgi:hypothetical protein